MKMRMKNIYCLVLFFAAACTSVVPEPVTDCASAAGMASVGDGLYVVDYAVADDVRSKALGDNLPASERISSLIYLLYDSDGNIVKERVIPDIGPDTIWPLRRPDAGGNMTWEQREALKDTLYSSSSYTAVFIANAGPSLFGLDGMSDDATVLHYKSAADGGTSGLSLYGLADGVSQDAYDYLSLEDIYLSLPPVAFSDGNMFYMCIKEIGDLDTAGDSDGVMDCPVVLHRIVSRTDICRNDRGTDYIGVPATDADAVSKADRAWSGYVLERVNGSLYPETVRAVALESVKDFMDGYATAFGLQAFEDIPDNLGYGIFAGKMKDDAVAQAVISGVDAIVGIEGQIVTYCHGKCAEDAGLRTLMSSWDGADVTLDMLNVADRFMVYSGEPAHVTASLPHVAYSSNSASDSNPGWLQVAGFGDGTTYNRLSAINLTSAVSGGWSIPVTDEFFLWNGPNRKSTAVCDPVASISCINKGNTVALEVTLDLGGLLRSSSLNLGWDEDYAAVLNKVAAEEGYGTLDNFKMRISIPQIESNVQASASLVLQ